MDLIMDMLSVGFGFIAAYRWYEASRIPIVRFLDAGSMKEPFDERKREQAWRTTFMETIAKSADANKEAALWTAAAVGLKALSILINRLT
jgi:hypothetical protein